MGRSEKGEREAGRKRGGGEQKQGEEGWKVYVVEGKERKDRQRNRLIHLFICLYM